MTLRPFCLAQARLPAEAGQGGAGGEALFCQTPADQRFIGCIGRAEIRSMNACGDEQNIQVLRVRTANVRRQTVANGQHLRAVEVRSLKLLQAAERRVIDRLVRLAGLRDTATQILIEAGEGTCAPDQLVAPLHNDIRIGADHQKPTGSKGLQLVPVIVRRLGFIVEQAGAADQICVRLVHDLKPRSVIEAEVALRADVETFALAAAGQNMARHIPGGDNVIIGMARHAKLGQLLVDRFCRAGGIGNENHRAALFLTETAECFVGGGKGSDTIVQDAPDIAENAPVIRRYGAEAGDEQGGCRVHGGLFRADLVTLAGIGTLSRAGWRTIYEAGRGRNRA